LVREQDAAASRPLDRTARARSGARWHGHHRRVAWMNGATPRSDAPGAAVTSERAKVLVVGGGQAGLTAGYYLAWAAVPFRILDAEARVGDAWRRRWDSLELFTAGRYSALPGLDFPGDPERFPGKDEVADYLERYARTFELPVSLNSRATALERAPGGYRVSTTSGTHQAEQVIVATGAYQRPHLPAIAARLGRGVTQLHSAEYRNPQQLPEGRVLVVGAANSGAQIAEDLAASHRVYLSRGTRLPRLPRRLLGKSLHWWAERLGLMTAPLEGSLRGRTQRGDLLIGTGLRQLARRRGVELAARTIDAHDRTVRFQDGRTLDVDSVVWATGYRADYSWIKLQIFDEHGEPRHRRGITDAPGLYFLGMHGQYSRGSSLIHWVKHDAAYLVEQLRANA
jgi:putative flavoprotein involved in K+ transport